MTFKGAEVASDADLIRLEIVNIPSSVTPIEFLKNPEAAIQKDDLSCIPGNSKGDGVITQTFGKILAVGPQRIEVENPVYPGNSGSPIIHIKTGKVIGILTEAELITLNQFEKESFKNKKSAIKSEIRYFGYRSDTVSSWNQFNWIAFSKANEDIELSNRELLWIVDYFYNTSNSYKDFKRLHEIHNSFVQSFERSNIAPADKIKAAQSFYSDVNYLIKRAQSRIKNHNFYYIHKQECEQINNLASRLTEIIAIFNRDTELVRILVERGF